MPEQHSPLPSQLSEHLRLQVIDLVFLDNGPYSFHLAAGECLGLSGPSGVGKTQLLRAVVDLIPHSGSIYCDGVEASLILPTRWRRKIGLIPTDPVWWFDSVGEHMVKDVSSGVFKKYLTLLGFTENVLDWEVSRLSTGERQRLGLLRGLLLEPAVLLLDEPTSGLDRSRADEVELLIGDYRQQKNAAVIWVSHDLEQLKRVADRMVRVEKNRLTDVGDAG